MTFHSPLLRETYEEGRHESGLRVLVFPKAMTSTYAVLATAFGSLDRSFRPDPSAPVLTVPAGTAHYLEHKLFDDPDGTDVFSRFSALGADANAYTGHTRTAYLFSTSEPFEAPLAELLRFVFTPYFTPASVEKERGIIAEEIRAGLDSPSERCAMAVLEGLYRTPAIRDDVAGTEETISGITADLLYRCHDVFYRPSNMTLCVCGDVTFDGVMEIVDRVLPSRSKPFTAVRLPFSEPPTAVRSDVSVTMPVAKPLYYLAVKDPVLPADPMARLRRDAAMSVLSETLFSLSSPFYNDLFEAGSITPSYSYGYSGCDRFAYHSVCGEGDDPKAVRDRFFAAVSTAMRQGLDPDDFLRARRCLVADQIRSYDATDEICENLLAFSTDGVDLFAYPDLLASVTPDDCLALLSDLSPDRACLSVVSAGPQAGIE